MKYRPLVVNDPWYYSNTSGSNIQGHIINAFRHFPGKLFKDGQSRFLHGQLNGKAVADSDEADALGLLYGYTRRYGRNSSGFVMSRAARKRGYKTTDRTYNYRASCQSAHAAKARRKAQKATYQGNHQ